MGSNVLGADLFDKPPTLAKLWPKIARGYALDALEREDGPATDMGAEGVLRWLAAAAGAAAEQHRSPGLGLDLRFEADAVVGSALAVDDRPVHLEVFSK